MFKNTGLGIKLSKKEKCWMVVKMKYQDKIYLALVRDLAGDGYIDEEDEERIDDKYYNEIEGDKRLEELSKELNLPILPIEGHFIENE